MMKFFIFSVALSLAAADDCKLSLFDECHYGTPFTSVHADNIGICEETCNIYAGIGSCDFYTYTSESAVDENCDIYTSTESQTDFQAGCNIVGKPIAGNDTCVSYEETCTVTPPCTFCTACGAGSCAGYMESNCQIKGGLLETLPVNNINTCNQLCNANGQSEFFVINREKNECECYDSTAIQNCKMAIVRQGTDINTCV